MLEPVEKIAFNSLELELPDIKIVSQFSGDEIPIQMEFHKLSQRAGYHILIVTSSAGNILLEAVIQWNYSGQA